jgi:hypothetical protein
MIYVCLGLITNFISIKTKNIRVLPLQSSGCAHAIFIAMLNPRQYIFGSPCGSRSFQERIPKLWLGNQRKGLGNQRIPIDKLSAVGVHCVRPLSQSARFRLTGLG